MQIMKKPAAEATHFGQFSTLNRQLGKRKRIRHQLGARGCTAALFQIALKDSFASVFFRLPVVKRFP